MTWEILSVEKTENYWRYTPAKGEGGIASFVHTGRLMFNLFARRDDNGNLRCFTYEAADELDALKQFSEEFEVATK